MDSFEVRSSGEEVGFCVFQNRDFVSSKNGILCFLKLGLATRYHGFSKTGTSYEISRVFLKSR